MNELLYINFSGFNLNVLDRLWEKYRIDDVKRKSIVDWRYILLTRRVIGFPMIFKNILDHYSNGTYYVKIFFYEQRDNPVEILLNITGSRSLIFIDSVPDIGRLMRRIISNPRYGETSLFIGKVELDIDELYEYDRLFKLAYKLFNELSPIVYSRGIGRFLGLKVREYGQKTEISLCVSREGVFIETTYRDIKLNIVNIDQCLS